MKVDFRNSWNQGLNLAGSVIFILCVMGSSLLTIDHMVANTANRALSSPFAMPVTGEGLAFTF
jgi:hypothetical protein